MIWVHQRSQKFPGGSALSLLRPSVEFTYFHSIYIRTFSSYRLLFTLLIQFKLVYGPFGQSNMHSTLDFCPRPARKQTNVPVHKEKLIAYCPNTSILCLLLESPQLNSWAQLSFEVSKQGQRSMKTAIKRFQVFGLIWY